MTDNLNYKTYSPPVSNFINSVSDDISVNNINLSWKVFKTLNNTVKTEIAVFNNSVNNWSSAYIAPSGYNWKISEQPYIIEWDEKMLLVIVKNRRPYAYQWCNAGKDTTKMSTIYVNDDPVLLLEMCESERMI